MANNICIFEDESYRNLLPLSYSRPVYELRCGITTLREKIVRNYPKAAVDLQCRDYLAPTLKQRHPEAMINKLSAAIACLFINGRVLADPDLSKSIPVAGPDEIFLRGEQVVALRLSQEHLAKVKEIFSIPFPKSLYEELKYKVKTTQVDVKLISYPWDLVGNNAGQIEEDFRILAGKSSLEEVPEGVYLINKLQIHLGKGVKIKPGVVLDAESGPIYIADEVTILPQTTIIGPAYIGKGSTLKVGAQIYGGTSVGEGCKVGGEVEGSIIHGFSNKQHAGFLGHSYLGMWVNLGAGTTNSDLKNNYGSVRVMIDGKEVDSKQIFVGLFMGDHSKTGINTMFNTGTVVGVASNVFGAGFPPKNIPSFAWGGAQKPEPYQLEKAVEVARIVMKRRRKELNPEEETLLRKIFELTREERLRSGVV